MSDSSIDNSVWLSAWMEMPCGPPRDRSHCGTCRCCVEACPAHALSGKKWHPGIRREEILDGLQCDQWKKAHYFEYHKGHICGICSAVCPYGTNTLKQHPHGGYRICPGHCGRVRGSAFPFHGLPSGQPLRQALGQSDAKRHCGYGPRSLAVCMAAPDYRSGAVYLVQR